MSPEPPRSPAGVFALETLGTLCLRSASGAQLVGARKELVLLAYIARRQPKPIDRAELATLIWGQRPEANARQSLRQALLRLKRELGEYLIVSSDQVSLAPGALEIDASLFESEMAAGHLADAVGRWRGDFLADADDAGGEDFRLWLEGEREGLRRRLSRAFERLVRDAESGGEREAALAWAEQWAERFPLDERAQSRVIELLRNAGRLDEALARYATFAVRTREETGRDQSPDWQRLGSVLERELRTPLALRAVSDAPVSSELVGRGAALNMLGEAWSAARAGSPQVVLVQGDEGLGKTRLCEEFLRLATARSPRVLVLRARAYRGLPIAKGAFAHELLAPLAGATGLLGAPAQTLADLAVLVPAIRTNVKGLPAPSSEAWAARDALATVLETVSEEVPVMLVLDELPGADDFSQELITSAICHLKAACVLVIVTARPDELSEWAWGRLLLDPREGSSAGRRLRLEPLPASEVERLVASLLELPEAELGSLAMRLYEETGGNPLFVTQMVTELVKEGHVTMTAGGQRRLSPALANRPLPYPATVRAATIRRLSCLSPDARALIDSAAAIGPTFDLADVTQLSGLPSAALYSALDQLVGGRLIRETASGSGRYTFTQGVMLWTAREIGASSASAHTHSRDSVMLDPQAESKSAPGDGEGDADRSPPGLGHGQRRRVTWRRAAATIVAVVIVAAAIAARAARAGSRAEEPIVIVVAPMVEYPSEDSARVDAALVDMLSTNLARVPGLQVVSNARLYDLLGDVGADGTRATVIQVAKAAGASELVEGALHRRKGGAFRLDLRRVDIRSGAVRSAFAVEGTDLFALVDSATIQIAASVRLRAGGLRIADVTTSSLVAYRLYLEGLRAFYQKSDARAAEQLFSSALAEDSSFAMAAYYLAIVTPFVGGPMFERFVAAAEKAEHASERERLIIQSAAALELNNPAALSIAESLATRFPADPSGHYLVGTGRVFGGDFLGAVPHLARTVDMDSLAFRGGAVSCRACEAMNQMTEAYWRADSLPAAERIAREWVRRQPASAAPWEVLAGILKHEGKYAQAHLVDDSVARLSPGSAGDPRLGDALEAIREENFVQADRLLGELMREGRRDTQLTLWYLTISLRAQGRLREALALARRVRALGKNPSAPASITQDALAEGQLLFETGRSRAAAALFDSLMVLTTDSLRPYMRWRNARGKTWFLTHVATATAAIGDTAALRLLADSIESAGQRSGYGRDRLLHHHARGLLAEARGDLVEAEREFRAAIYSLTLGYTRTNLELARVLLGLKRPRDAVSVLQPALRGELDASNFYVTRTELREALAQAFDQAGEVDSAAANFRAVVSAWRRADPALQPRVAAASARLAALSKSSR